MPNEDPRDDLEQFVDADLVNPNYSDADLRSKLFLQTIADVAQATTSVVNSPYGGLSGPNQVTRTLAGAGRTLHLLTNGIGGQGSAKVVGLMLFVLTLASTLLIVSVFVSDTPAWVTTVGFAALLGGIAAVALHTRQPVLGMLLLTLWLPLVVWSLTPEEGPGAPSDWIGPTLTVIGVAAVLWLVGSVPFTRPHGPATLVPGSRIAGAAAGPAIYNHTRSGSGARLTTPGDIEQETHLPGRWRRTVAVIGWVVLVGLAVVLAFTGWSPIEVAGSDPVEYLVPGTVWTVLGSALLHSTVFLAVGLVGVSGGLVFLVRRASAARYAPWIERWTFWFGVGYLVAGLGLLAWLTGSIGSAGDTGRYWPMTVSLLLLGVACLLLTIWLRTRSLRRDS